MPRWEYFVLLVNFAKENEAKNFMNEYGAGGWELVSAAHDDRNVWRLFFKRQIERS